MNLKQSNNPNLKINLDLPDRPKELDSIRSTYRKFIVKSTTTSLNLSKINSSKYLNSINYDDDGTSVSSASVIGGITTKLSNTTRSGYEASLEGECDLEKSIRYTPQRKNVYNISNGGHENKSFLCKEYDNYYFVSPYSTIHNKEFRNTKKMTNDKDEAILIKDNLCSPSSAIRSLHFKKNSVNREKIHLVSNKNESDIDNRITDIKRKLSLITKKLKNLNKYVSFKDENIANCISLYASNMLCHNDNIMEKFSLGRMDEMNLIQSIIEIEGMFLRLLKQIETKITKQDKGDQEQKVKIRELELQILKLNQRIDLNQPPYQLETNNIELSDHILNKPKPTSTMMMNLNLDTNDEYHKKENVFQAEKQKLLSHIYILTNKIKELNPEGPLATRLRKELNDLKDTNNQEILKLQKIIESKENKLAKAELNLTSMKLTIKNLESKLKQIEDQNSTNFSKAGGLEHDLIVLKQHSDQQREIVLMQNEEILGLQIRSQKYYKYINMAKQRLAEKEAKLKEFYRVLGNNTSILEEKKSINEIIEEMKLLFKGNSNNKFSIEEQSLSLSINAKEEDNINNTDTSKYTSFRPNFYVLIEADYKKYLERLKIGSDNKNDIKETILDYSYISLIRGMLDSKYNEYALNMNQNGLYNTSIYTRFPEFVYSWLSKYEFCMKTQKILYNAKIDDSDNIDNDNNTDLRRGRFIHYMKNPLLNKLWDVMTFKEFLFEECHVDEVYFYLHYRNILYEGPELNKLSSSLNIIHNILYDKTEILTDIVLHSLQMPNDIICNIKHKIKLRAKKKYGKLFIDGNFVLRILLEYYRTSRKNILSRVKLSFRQFSTNDNNHMVANIDFSNFKKFIDANFPNSTELEKSSLYREAYTIGRGNITYESFMAAAINMNFFMKTLKLRNLNDMPPIDFTGSTLNDRIEGKICNLITNHYQKHNLLVEYIKDQANSLGCENISMHFINYQHVIENKFNLPQHELRGMNWITFYNEFLSLMVKINHLTVLLRAKEYNMQYNIMSRLIDQFEQFYNDIFQEKLQYQSEIILKNSSAKKLQVFLLQKTSKWLAILNEVFNKKFSKKINKIATR